jgi:hypothetical protein
MINLGVNIYNAAQAAAIFLIAKKNEATRK